MFDTKKFQQAEAANFRAASFDAMRTLRWTNCNVTTRSGCQRHDTRVAARFRECLAVIRSPAIVTCQCQQKFASCSFAHRRRLSHRYRLQKSTRILRICVVGSKLSHHPSQPFSGAWRPRGTQHHAAPAQPAGPSWPAGPCRSLPAGVQHVDMHALRTI